MSEFVIAPPPQAALAVAGDTARFPVRRVFCVGRNYGDHAREMGHDPDREPPFFFTKPADAVTGEAQVPYPPQTADLHHEIELVVALGAAARNVAPEAALDLVWGAGVGVDLTRRDMQAQAKSMRRPWDMAKGFDASAPIAPLVPMARVPSLNAGRIWLAVDGDIRQEGDLAQQIWPVADVISILSHSVALAPGDLIMTGTPAGVGAIAPGQTITGGIDGLGDIRFQMGPAPAG